MQINQNALIDELLELTEKASETVNGFRDLPSSALNFKNSNCEWSILECLGHLNLYGDFYLPEIEKQILNSKTIDRDQIYESSFLGDYFVKLVRVNNKKKMKATKSMVPQYSDLSETTIDKFLKQLELLKSLLNQARNRDLIKVKTAISLTKLLKLRLGDTLRFLVHHNERHVLQALRVKDKKNSSQLVV